MTGQTILVPAGEGRAIHVLAGERFRVIDLHGQQGVDLFVFCTTDVSE